MTWFKVDDAFHSHPKAKRVGVGALGLWVACGSWSASYLTDGFVPRTYVATWGNNGSRLAARLVTVGLWYPDERDGQKGWSFHDWAEFQPTKEDVESKRKADRLRKESARKARGIQEESDRIPLYPDPTRPDPSFDSGYLGGRSNVSSDSPPPCQKHPNGPNHDDPCRHCKRIREHLEAAPAAQAEHLKAQRAAFWDTVRDCPDCDERGLVETRNNSVAKCPRHDWTVVAHA